MPAKLHRLFGKRKPGISKFSHAADGFAGCPENRWFAKGEHRPTPFIISSLNLLEKFSA
jgi:hypothetical protein